MVALLVLVRLTHRSDLLLGDRLERQEFVLVLVVVVKGVARGTARPREEAGLVGNGAAIC